MIRIVRCHGEPSTGLELEPAKEKRAATTKNLCNLSFKILEDAIQQGISVRLSNCPDRLQSLSFSLLAAISIFPDWTVQFRRTWLCEHGSVASVDSRGEGLDVLLTCRVQPARTHLGDAYTAHAQGSSSISAHAFTNIDVLNTINFREGSSIEAARYVLD